MEPHLTTPFGRRSLSLAHVAAQANARRRPPQASAHKWSVFRALCAARERLGLSERSLAVLDALLSFHPETVLAGDALVVFPSNEQLSLRAHGMPASTLRRHLAVLVDAGILLRRDSPNGKRYARKGRDGEIARAFGFDLSPLVARAAEFEAIAEDVRAQERALRYARERLTLLRRDLAKMVATGIEEAAPLPAAARYPAAWEDLHARYRAIVAGLPRRASLDQLDAAAAELADLAEFASKALENHAYAKILGGNESRDERHIQNSKPQSLLEIEPALRKTRGAAEIVLPLVLRACPDIADYARNPIGHWRDLVAAASVARAALGVSPSAWEAAQSAMGERSAAAAVAAILQRGVAISSPGGYLRELTRKAEANAFSVAPMLMALVGARRRPGEIRELSSPERVILR